MFDDVKDWLGAAATAAYVILYIAMAVHFAARCGLLEGCR